MIVCRRVQVYNTMVLYTFGMPRVGNYDYAESVVSEWKECRGMPFNEDLECGWSAVNHLLGDHFNYFGMRVGSVCWNQSHQVAAMILRKNGRLLTILLCSRTQCS